jgi:hypothetical protein
MSGSPKFDVHGYSGCPLQVLHAPSFSIVRQIVDGFNSPTSAQTVSTKFSEESLNSRTRYFVLKLSSSESYNPRLKKQAEKQQFFHQEMNCVDKEQHEDSKKEESGFFLQIPPILYLSSDVTEQIRSFLLDDEAVKKCFPSNVQQQQQHDQAFIKNFIEQWKTETFSTSQREKLIEKMNREEKLENLSGVLMPFVHHTDCLRFLCTADFQRIKRFEDHLCYFFEWQVKRCQMKPLPIDIIVAKLEDLRKVCSRSESLLRKLPLSESSKNLLASFLLFPCSAKPETISDACLLLLEKLIRFFQPATTEKEDISIKIKSLQIPMGFCHGDLTLSNILIQESTNDKIVLIDFLDSFLESPLSDMCKINQDLSHGWTIRMLATNNTTKQEEKGAKPTNKNEESSNSVDPVRLYVLFQRMMKKVVLEPFGKEIWFQKLFRPLCVISQMRVLQYSVEETVARYLWDTIEQEVKLCDAELWK